MFFLADIGDSLDRAWDEFFIWLPRLVGFLAIVLIGYIVAKIVEGIVTRVSTEQVWMGSWRVVPAGAL